MTSTFQSQLLRGHVAYVAGGSSGINMQIGKSMAEYGASVAIVSRSTDKVDAAAAAINASGGSALGIPADVRDYDAIAASLEQTKTVLGVPTIVVSGAAGNFVAPAHKMSANGFKTVVDIDLLGTFNVFRAAYDIVRGQRASFIAISAPQASQPYRLQAHVCAAKAGVEMLTKCLALEWGGDGIRVNAIVPGPIDGTVGMDKLAPSVAARKAQEQKLPLLRYGTTQDVANLSLFLASAASEYMTGAIIPCDGGVGLIGSLDVGAPAATAS
jgi:NAD(P)-dependent dehydrogenase (short-subunit alcohol dehydrogenase family)